MKIFDSQNGQNLQTLLQSLNSTAQGSMRVFGAQNQRLTSSTLESILGSQDEFMNRYKQFEQEYFRMLTDKKNLSKFTGPIDIDMERLSGKINLNNLNYKTQKQLTQMFKENVLRMDELFSQVGIPGMEFPSSNLFRSALKYDVADLSHPAAVFLNRLFFNVDIYKSGQETFDFTKSLLSSNALENIMATQNMQIAKDARILTLDVETTGVTRGSQVRSFAYQLNDSDGKIIKMMGEDQVSMAYENPLMDTARMRTSPSGTSVRMSRQVNVLEGAKNVKAMDDGGLAFIQDTKALLQQMLESQHISGHNVRFDLTQMYETSKALNAAVKDQEIMGMFKDLYTRINEQSDYLIDTAETLRSYFTEKVSSIVGTDGARSAQIVQQMLAPEAMARATIGGSIAPISVENLALNTNLFQLIESDPVLAQEITDRLSKGAHIASTDIKIQGLLEEYRRKGLLDFRFSILEGQQVDDLTEFEKFARARMLQSSAITPTTNIASVQHLSQASFNYLTSDQGLHRAQITTNASQLGLPGNDEGILSLDKKTGEYKFTPFATSGKSDSIIVPDKNKAKDLMTNTLNEARKQATDQKITLKSGAVIQTTRNVADESVIKIQMSYTDETQADLMRGISAAVAPITALMGGKLGEESKLIRSLAITNEQFATKKQTSGILRNISNALRNTPTVATRNPLEFDDSILVGYSQGVAEAGLPYAQLDPVSRVMSVKMAEATASVGEASREALPYAHHARLTTETGLSFFRAQQYSRLTQGFDTQSITPATKPIAGFSTIFDVTDDGMIKVKPFNNLNIADTNLNRFTLSLVQGSMDDIDPEIPPRMNLVWGANGTFDDLQSKQLAEYLLETSANSNDLLNTLNIADEDLTKDLRVAIDDAANVKAAKTIAGAPGSQSPYDNLVGRLSEVIKDRGIVVGYNEGPVAEAIRLMLAQSGIDLVDNEVQLQNLVMRLLHANDGIMTMGAMVNANAAEMAGVTDAELQAEGRSAIEKAREIVDILMSDKNTRKQAQRVVSEGAQASPLDRVFDSAVGRAAREFMTPMTDFYIANKKSIGYGALGVAALGAGYYMFNRVQESNQYEQTIEQQPTDSTIKRNMTISDMMDAQPRSTRRDPLTTAGVVGNLDRNKIGHTNMGKGKYDHLYGG